MTNFDDVTNKNKIESNSKWSYVPHYPYRILIRNRRFWIRKNKYIIKFNKNQPDIDKIYLSSKDPYQAK